MPSAADRRPVIGWAVLAGILAGVVTALFALLAVEPSLSQAIALEDAAAQADEPGHAGEPTVSRAVQQAALFLVLPTVGAALGLLLGLVHRGLHGRDRAVAWPEAARLAAAGFVALSLVPFLAAPANPPGVGDPDTVDERTRAWLLAILVGVAAVALAWRLAALAVERGLRQPVPALVVAVVVAAGIAAAVSLPAPRDAVGLPAQLVWDFRIASLGAQAVLWGALAIAVAWLGRKRAVVPAGDPQPATGTR